ncbi:hypothetical protein ACRV44_005288 [Klebsiella pneumoniae]|uniref:hypothetical protein n=1 Tax=Klebsiella pneumoniae TaxID=573 RepID=UPI000E2C0C91|nr:hypothetical protein [Klebsiella pneumoniae]HDS4944069.1 hypothetical protein [Klebsiella pneumoniae subsp. ozaenae]HDS5723017.1 hypothetical protein [Klebsiella pneumoniae subsp. pneumoniae]MCM6310851.1 hypothetical protein [Klebsiella pneumoniae]MCR1017853.1 hypothetical protein [Klebsiella pneumoniae]MCR1030241.1 hypothetical protein [Klebsiella pneumoniae]
MALPKSIKEFYSYDEYYFIKECSRCACRRKHMLYTDLVDIERSVPYSENVSDAQQMFEWACEETEIVQAEVAFVSCCKRHKRDMISFLDCFTDDVLKKYKKTLSKDK